MMEADDESRRELLEAAKSFLLAIKEDGLDELVPMLVGQLGDEALPRRRVASSLLNNYCRSAKDLHVSLAGHAATLMRGLLGSFMDRDKSVLSEAWGALDAVMATITEDKHVHLQQALQVLHVLAERVGTGELPGLCQPKGIDPLVPIVIECLSGHNDSKEIAAEVLTLLVRLTSVETLAPCVIKVTGPLIRVASDNSPEIKVAMLGAICALLRKAPEKLKPMVPQLQPTCIKNLKEPAKNVRARALEAFELLIPLQKRVDPVLQELLTSATAAGTDVGIQTTHIGALAAVMTGAGEHATGPKKVEVADRLATVFLGSEDDDLRAVSKKKKKKKKKNKGK
jgi:hypothetical protein